MPLFLIEPTNDEYDRAMTLFAKVLDHAGDGAHTLTVATHALDGPATVKFSFTLRGQGDEETALALCTLISAAITGAHSTAVLLRTHTGPETSCVRGWHIVGGEPFPLTGGELLTAYCTDYKTGEIHHGPGPGTEYEDAPTLSL
ncbi:hypothetical protein [Streptomyces fradiae]|uniref:hypothetical protein n=1 Tax=Streptomyces fradiae TaxID=1906 RepID=UPI0037F7CD07